MNYEEMQKSPDLDSNTMYALNKAKVDDRHYFDLTKLFYVIQSEDSWKAMNKSERTFDLASSAYLRCSNGYDTGVLWGFKELTDAIEFRLIWC